MRIAFTTDDLDLDAVSADMTNTFGISNTFWRFMTRHDSSSRVYVNNIHENDNRKSGNIIV